jgi:hypothetical protein
LARDARRRELAGRQGRSTLAGRATVFAGVALWRGCAARLPTATAIPAYLERVAARPKVKEAMKAEGLLQ